MIIEKNMDTLMYSWIISTQKIFGDTHNKRNIFILFYCHWENYKIAYTNIHMKLPSCYLNLGNSIPFLHVCESITISNNMFSDVIVNMLIDFVVFSYIQLQIVYNKIWCQIYTFLKIVNFIASISQLVFNCACLSLTT
jgi:hypothetical protein